MLHQAKTATRFALSSALLLSVQAVPSAQAIEARVDLTGLLCVKTTAEPYSDEPFVIATPHLLGTNSTAEVHLPPPTKYYPNPFNPYQWVWSYPSYGDIDGYDWVIDDRKIIWQGWLQPGETIVVPIAFWEKDSGYTAHDYLEDMAMVIIDEAPTWLVGGGLSNEAILEMAIYSAKFLFGAGSDDPLGNLAVSVTNNAGYLQKEILAGEYAFLGGETYKDIVSVPYYKKAQYESLGYDFLGWNGSFLVLMCKSSYYGKTSKSKKTIRAVLDGAGNERYHASLQVRQGPFTSSKPHGTCHTWTAPNSTVAW